MCNWHERKPTENELHNLKSGYKVFIVNSVTGEIHSPFHHEYMFPNDYVWIETKVNIDHPEEGVGCCSQDGYHVIIKKKNAEEFREVMKRERPEYLKANESFQVRKVEISGLIALGKLSPSTVGDQIYMGDRRSIVRCRRLRIVKEEGKIKRLPLWNE